MPGIPNRYFYQLVRNVETLKERWLTLDQIGFTHDEFLALFAPKEHWDILKYAGQIGQTDTAGGEHEGHFEDYRLGDLKKVRLNFTVNAIEGKAPLLPRNESILEGTPPETLDKIASWVIKRAEAGYAFSRCGTLLSWLSGNCSSPAQVRYLWPSLIALCALHENTAELGHKLRDVPSPRHLPAIPAPVKEALRLAAATISSASLLPAESEPFNPPVTIALWSAPARSGFADGYSLSAL